MPSGGPLKKEFDMEVQAGMLETLCEEAISFAEMDELDVWSALIGDARFVLLGEATHGTHEFYAGRARLTRRLILEKGFNVVAVEADWPDAARVNRYIQHRSDDS